VQLSIRALSRYVSYLPRKCGVLQDEPGVRKSSSRTERERDALNAALRALFILAVVSNIIAASSAKSKLPLAMKV
jgi:hypothetical protein